MTDHPHIVDQARPDVVWNATTQLWYCCGVDSGGNPNCEDPTNESFDAPAPTSLVAYFTVTPGSVATSTSIAVSATSSISSSTSSVASSTSAPANVSSTAHSGSHAKLSAGAAAGIGVGCTAAVVIIGCLIACMFLRSHKRKRMHHAEPRIIYTDAPVYTHEIGPGK